MLPFLTLPAVTSACYVPRERDTASAVFHGSQWLTRTPSSASPDRTSWTLSWWMDVTAFDSERVIFSTHRNSAASGVTWVYVCILPDNRLRVFEAYQVNQGSALWEILTVNKLRDIGYAHYHVQFDSMASGDDKIQLYVNGVRQAVSQSNPPPAHTCVLGTAVPHYIGRYYDAIGAGLLNGAEGLISDIRLIVGTALPVAAMGEFNLHGVWVARPCAEIDAAIATAGGYGSAGFHLDFSVATSPGTDVSGLGNHWTATGFDTAGGDSVTSTPTNRYAVLNRLAETADYLALSDGGLRATSVSSTGSGNGFSTLPIMTKTYFEATIVSLSSSQHAVGVVSQPEYGIGANPLGGINWYIAAGQIWDVSGATVATASAAVGDTIGIECDPQAGQVRFWRIDSSETLVATVSGLPAVPLWARVNGNALSGTSIWSVNFGQRPWRRQPSSGYEGLCTANLPKPSVKDPAEGLAQASASGADMAAALAVASTRWGGSDYVEIVKRRDAAEDWRVRFSDDPGNGWAFNNANPKAAAFALAATGNYVGHRLRVGGKYGVWTGEVAHTTGTATTVTHNLGTARAVVIATRVSTGGGDRYLWHPDMTAGQLLRLNGTAQPAADGTLTGFAATSCRIGASAPSGTYRVLVLAERSGWLSLTRYVGNGGAADGAFVPMDIAPLLTLTACVSGSGSRYLNDAVRSGGNPTASMALDSQAVESAGVTADLVVGGIKMRNADAGQNGSGQQYVAVAFGRPVGGVCVAPATAR